MVKEGLSCGSGKHQCDNLQTKLGKGRLSCGSISQFHGLWTVSLTISRNVPERSGDLEGELSVLEVRFHVAVLQLHLQSGFPLINYRSCH